MGDKTKIEWTDASWNPLVGCSRVSPGCDACYAIGVVHRGMSPQHRGLTVHPEGERVDWTGEVREVPHLLDQPLRWKRPRRIFVNSLSDLFHPDVSFDFIVKVFDVMVRCPQHTFQILTKRPQRMASVMTDRPATPDEVDAGCELGIFPGVWDLVNGGTPAPNIWLGTSIESARYAFRADHLRATEAAVRFVSAEPLLDDLAPALDLDGIDWLIVGGESGPGARPMNPAWARALRDRCIASGVPFLFKQWGKWHPLDDSDPGYLIGFPDGVRTEIESMPPLVNLGKKGGRELEGRTWDQYPQTGPCPRDTDGDGNCGQALCPVCGPLR